MTSAQALPRNKNTLLLNEKTTVNQGFIDCISQSLDHPSIPSAFEQDPKYTTVYDEYVQTGTVHPLLVDREGLSMMIHWISSRFGQPPKDDYADTHVSISAANRTLTIKHWLIAHPTLSIKLEDISYILPAAYVVPKSGVAAWGVGSTGVGWGRDIQRVDGTGKAYQRSYVCKFKNQSQEFYAGFTVDMPESFVAVLEDAWHND